MKLWLIRFLVASLFVAAWPMPALARPEPPGAAAWLADPARPDPATTAPAAVARFFARLTPAQRAALAARYPGVVGNLDGAPVELRYAANAGAGAHLLADDPRGDGKRVQVVGDLATAARIAVLIPGVDTTAGNFSTGLGGVVRRAPAWQAQQLFRAANDPGLAVVAWLGYDPPEGIGLAAIRSERAEAGAKSLRRFLDGLVTVRPQAQIVLIGHSYGTIVLARTASHLPSQVTDLVLLGSPGVDSATSRGLTKRARLWIGSAPGDWTRWLPDMRILGLGHGANPAHPWFTGHRLDASGVAGHDGYFEPGTALMAQLAAISTARL